MSRIDPSRQALMPSVLDRLIDPQSSGTAAQRGYTVNQMTEAVRRDLTELLNSRLSHYDLPPEYVEVRSSILCYGLPDLTSLNAILPSERVRIGRLIEGIISDFEPRLKDVRASVLTQGETLERSI